MSDSLQLQGTIVGDYQIQRKRKSFDTLAPFFEGLNRETRDTIWTMVYPSELLEKSKVTNSIEKELELLTSFQHDRWLPIIDTVRDDETNHLFLIYNLYSRSRQLDDLVGKIKEDELPKLFLGLLDLLEETHKAEIFGWLDTRQIFVRRQGMNFDFAWLRPPGLFHRYRLRSMMGIEQGNMFSYMSPESLAGERASPVSDFFSFGSILFEVLSGKRCFQANSNIRTIEMVLEGTSPALKNSRLSPEKKELIQDLLQIHPNDRLSDYTELRDRLSSLLDPERASEEKRERERLIAKKLRDSTPASGEVIPSFEEVVEEEPVVAIEEVEASKIEAEDLKVLSKKADIEELNALASEIALGGKAPLSEDADRGGASIELADEPVPEPKKKKKKKLWGRKKKEKAEAPKGQKQEKEKEKEEEEALPRGLPEGEAAPEPVIGEGLAESTLEEELAETEVLRRKGVVRSYTQMNPGKIFPLLVSIIEASLYIKTPDLPEVQQVESEQVMEVEESSPYVRVVPVLPGCIISPAEAVVDLREPKVDIEFWVAPQSEGDLRRSARVQIWHEGVLKDEIPIPCRVRTHTLTKIASYTSVLSSIAGTALETYGPQRGASGGGGNDSIGSYLLQKTIALLSSSGVWLGLFFLLCAVLCYLWLRPKRGDATEAFLTTDLH